MNEVVSGRILIFVVAYNAQKHIKETLRRIPEDWLKKINYQILILDDASTDNTVSAITEFLKEYPDWNIEFRTNKANMGYGGNQKLGYQYARENDFAYVVLLHGDGQYAPEYLPEMMAPLQENHADLVLGSRMIHKMNALKGKMPLYKWIGNQILTSIQNILLNTQISEFHTGYRAFRVSAIKAIPIHFNSNYYDFDTEIIIQLLDTNNRLKEISIPTFYGEEISYVNGFKYAWLILYATFKSRLVRRGILADPRFEYTNDF